MKINKIVVTGCLVALFVGVNLSVHLGQKQCPARGYLPSRDFPKVASLLEYKEAGAIAAWAQRYNADCTMCHTMIPRLNPVGHKFRRLGYQMPDEFDNREKGGQKSWEEISKLRNYLAVRARAGALFMRQSGVSTFSFSSATLPPPDMTIFYAGPVTRNLSIFSEFAFDPDGAAFEVGQMNFHFGSSDRFFFGRVGKFHDFSKVGYGGLDRPIALTFPQVFNKFINGYRPRTDQIGLEAGYSWGDFTGLIEVTNGIKATGDAVGGQLDPNNHKDIAALLEYMVPNHDASVSLLYIYGQAPIPTDSAGNAVSANPTKYNRVYAFADYTFEPIGLKPIIGAGLGIDNQFITNLGVGDITKVPPITSAGLLTASNSTSWFTFLELDQRITDNLYGVARFDYFDPTTQFESSSATAKTWAATSALAWSFQRYLRLTGEYTVLDNSFQSAAHNLKVEAQMNF